MPILADKRLFTVEDYYRMAEAGILGEDDRVELIEGEIVQMTPIGIRHASCVKRLIALFTRRLSTRTIVCAQDPIHLGEHTEPQPDIVLAKPCDDYYKSSHPTPDDIFLIIEVADSSIEYDRQNKIPIYGRCGIPESWLVDLNRKMIEIYTMPSEEGYRNKTIINQGQTVSPLAFPELKITVDEIIG